MCTIDRFAMSFLESFDDPKDIVPNITEIKATTHRISHVIKKPVPKKVTIDTVANFSAYPANATDPGHEAST